MAKAKKEQTPDEAMAKNEKHNDGSMSGLKKLSLEQWVH